ncbi:MAG TPA: hypothetical protein VHA33_10065 [Candidatus Angelobacter sp.]|nr:hypothetical protein [Candidatus Angelobacter sp.]
MSPQSCVIEAVDSELGRIVSSLTYLGCDSVRHDYRTGRLGLGSSPPQDDKINVGDKW